MLNLFYCPQLPYESRKALNFLFRAVLTHTYAYVHILVLSQVLVTCLRNEITFLVHLFEATELNILLN